MDWIIAFIELIFDAICDGWIYLMQKLVPDKMKNKKVRIVLKISIAVFSMVTLMLIIAGICLLTSNNVTDKKNGWLLIVSGSLIIVISIVLIVKSRKAFKK